MITLPNDFDTNVRPLIHGGYTNLSKEEKVVYLNRHYNWFKTEYLKVMDTELPDFPELEKINGSKET